MKVNVWGINYAPELTGIGVYTTQMCDYLAENGDDVTVVTGFAYYPEWKGRDSDRYCWLRSEQIGKVAVHRCWLYIPSTPSVIKRILHEFSFVFTSFFRQLALPRPDVYLVISPPLLLGFAAWIISRLKSVPFILHVQDLQPDAAMQLSMIKPGPMLSALRWLERFNYAKAVRVCGISPQMQSAFVSKGTACEKTYLFPNWVCLKQYSNGSNSSWKQTHGIDPSTQIVSYAGNIGNKQGLELIVQAAKYAENRNLLFVIAGDGVARPSLQAMANELGLTNLQFHPVLSEEEHTALLCDSAVCLIIQKPGTGASFLPSKLLKILALSKPVLTNADSESALFDAVQEGHFGLVVQSGDPVAVCDAIIDLVSDRETRVAMGEAGREYIQRFERDTVLRQFQGLLHNESHPRRKKLA
jgi:colanic acid biosynthesis glycosyl transferase WcaI